MLVPMILNYLAVYLNLRTTLLNPLGRSSTVSRNQTLYLARGAIRRPSATLLMLGRRAKTAVGEPGGHFARLGVAGRRSRPLRAGGGALRDWQARVASRRLVSPGG